MKYENLLLVVTALTIVGCDTSDIPDLKGRYVGERRNGDLTEQLIAEVPAVRKENKQYRFDFDLFTMTLPSNKEQIQVRFSKDDKATLVATSLSGAPISLKVNGQCANGSVDGSPLSLCWSDSDIRLTLGSFMEVSLKKSNELPLSQYEPDHDFKLEEVMARAKYSAYGVQTEAERLFQAKKGISVAFGNLLPHFNIRDLFPIVTGAGPLGLIEVVGDILPFLFPSNWYKWRAAKAAYRAEKKSYASLRGNQMNQMEGLYYVVHRDIGTRALVKEHLDTLTRIHSVVAQREKFGQMVVGSANRFYLSVVEVEQDLDQMDVLLGEELSSLSHGVALPPASGIKELAALKMPDPSQLKPIKYEEVLKTAVDSSYELATMVELIDHARTQKGEFMFGFLDPNSSASIGFGYAATLMVSKSKVKELEIKKEETRSLIEKNTVDTSNQFNNALKAFQLAEKGLTMANQQLRLLHERLRLGDDSISEEGFVEELRETARQVLKFRAARSTAQYTLLITQSKVNRLLLTGFYTDLEAAIPQEGEEQNDDE